MAYSRARSASNRTGSYERSGDCSGVISSGGGTPDLRYSLSGVQLPPTGEARQEASSSAHQVAGGSAANSGPASSTSSPA